MDGRGFANAAQRQLSAHPSVIPEPHERQLVMQTSVPAEPLKRQQPQSGSGLPKKPKRSASDLVREQKERPARTLSSQVSSEVPCATTRGVPLAGGLAAVEAEVNFIAEDVGGQYIIDDRVKEGAAILSVTGTRHSASTDAFHASAQQQAEKTQPTLADPSLQRSEDLGCDFSVKTALRLSTPHLSFRWLHRLPSVLRCQPSRLSSAARESVLDTCRECLPALVEDPDKAVRWLERIAGCLSWHELEGPAVPRTSRINPCQRPDECQAWRRVDEWAEAFASLEVLLRQNLCASFMIVTDRFSVTVLGEGSGPWEPQRDGAVSTATQSAPCAVLCPSVPDIRTMLEENHVPFEVADEVEPTDEPSTHEIQSEMRELVRDGERIGLPKDVKRSSALWFAGSWRVHALLDVLRQYFLGAPVAGSIAPPIRLPRLVAPVAFRSSHVCEAEVAKTVMTQASAKAVAPAELGARHIVELNGWFFPFQVRRLLELLRVLLPSFSCTLTVEPHHSVGVNTFTQLGMRYIASVDCESAGPRADGVNTWKWGFSLGGS
eukprot:gnl/TRDRNA2_/TRDRNA2_35081_c0_seq1.p1 gnl/TRDRNA2_/TRDRNA2_35081_c0~~gnl/TRDRNA2_/TRDRNA2_35081_c0_seq1.p1  ORF type:complete len:548 (+),score=65.26 gnl/TRDRNA2_/TRDRNA2_35081_c0_seq1:71-1714(+)